MIQSNSKGVHYSQNIVDDILSFNSASTWSVVGTGSASIEPTIYFEGSGSLNIENTSVKEDITASNVTQNTVIDIEGNYDIGCYLLKKEALLVVTGEIEIFKNDVALDTQTFSLGSEDADKDKTDEWVSFFSNDNYSLSPGDKITFAFKIDGIPSSDLTSLDLFIDGFMVYDKNRCQLEAPLYTRPVSEGKQSFGVYDYNDLATQTTPIDLVLADTQYELTNDGEGSFTNKTYALNGIPDVWDVLTNRFDFTSLELGDTVDIRFDISVTTSSANTAISVFLELGTGVSTYQLPLIPSANFKTTGSYGLIRWFGIYMGDSNTLDNPGKVVIESDSTGATAVVNGWYIRPSKRII